MAGLKKIFLDEYLVKSGLVTDIKQARAWIMAGKILVDGQIVYQRGQKVSSKNEIVIKKEPEFVSRGGEKLESALRSFGIEVKNKVALDVGASVGGFTDCLLKHKAKLVYALDCGKNLLHEKLKSDPRVKDISGVNFRYFPAFASKFISQKVDLVVIDVSFISLKIILSALKDFLQKQNGPEKVDVLALVKPQFEAKYNEVKKGLVREERVIQRCVQEISQWAKELGFKVIGSVKSEITGKKGNQEYFLWLVWNEE